MKFGEKRGTEMSEPNQRPLTPLHKRIARLVVAGLNEAQIVEVTGLTRSSVRRARQSEKFQAYVQELETTFSKIVEDALLEGEIEAVETIKKALNAETQYTTQENGINVRVKKPDWDVRLRAAFRLLDMQGRRGKPVDKVESKNIEITGDLGVMLRDALRDPGVQGWLEGTGRSVPLLTQVVGVEHAPPPEPSDPYFQIVEENHEAGGLGKNGNVEAANDGVGGEASDGGQNE